MTDRPRFGVWANVHGTMAALCHPDDPVDASWRRVRDQILLAERLGFDSTLIAQHTMNPLGESLDQLDAWSAAAAAAALTQSIEIIAAVKPSIIHPTILAKQAQGIEEISGGRFAVNVVNAWWIPDLERSGIGMLEHGERYVYGSEWLHVVRRLLAGERTTFHGKYFHVDDFVLHPTGTFRQRPRIYLGGESAPARDLAAAEADVLFLNGQSRSEAVDLITDVRRRARTGLDPLRFGLAAFVVTAPTGREAEDLLRHHWELNAADKAGDGDTIDRFSADTDPASPMWQRLRERPHIGPNGGTAAGLVGDYDTVAQRIVDWHVDGIETFMLAFQPFEAEMERFAAEIIPRVERLTNRSLAAS
ncbi:LLM class flavin-dependent oxidoreductase [Mycolicibacterium rufum]|uniref:LLM class flavin-dependent oxidoreductase n=1 Tax=Mycolicibacterium rufum TaxID=318424 RepID=A0A9X2YIH7_9MYCO|nr:LLM class flavin-dependent oxidoreductase [Mycolicibacterium rufum]KGI68967.1 5,10-methylene tetrahydromethanopterin reductase [Mycolicibacterium rufum]MCV7073311.1 LLM class flavin-dependent oxidoreductase [Mycolicibacterium rufum]ULP35137.1 LLM class flavin-dependent oxidoreductase [Mycolicibacterium rufum]